MKRAFSFLLKAGLLATFFLTAQASVFNSSVLRGSFKAVLIPSENYATFKALMSRQVSESINLKALLYLPKSTSNKKYPAVILLHGSEGIQDQKEGAYARYFVKHHIATLVIDSYRSRNMHNTLEDQGKLSFPSQIADVLNAFKFLQAQPNINPEQIGIMGTSRGGLIALLINQKQLINKYLKDNKPAFLIAFYPCCLLSWQKPDFLNIPVLMMMAGNDNECSPVQCEDYAKILKQHQQKIKAIVLKNACHGYDVDYACKHFIDVHSFKACPVSKITNSYHILTNKQESNT